MPLWSNGGPLEVAARLQGVENNLRQGAAALLLDVVSQAEKNQTDTLQKAVTQTGEERVSSGAGGSPGRAETGLMINSTTAKVTQDENEITGEWGWQDPEDYFGYQDQGTKTVPAALSLFTSFIVAKSDLARRLRTLMQSGGN